VACTAWGRWNTKRTSRSFTSRGRAGVYALNRVVRAWGKWNLDFDRHPLEQIPPEDYLRMSYYERWATRLFNQVVRFRFVTPVELASGRAEPGSAKVTPALTAAMSARSVNRGIPSAVDPKVVPRFKVGQVFLTDHFTLSADGKVLTLDAISGPDPAHGDRAMVVYDRR
jgi:hypothetical protein